jgi:tetratricopeptide (TPR) repeat protein
MKKFYAALSILILVAAVTISFTACDKLKVDNLTANQHLKNANRFYGEEKYKKAADEYELALQFNPNLSSAFAYVGDCYSKLYRPGDETDKNKEYGNKAITYLEKADKFAPGRKEIILALGYVYDLMRNFEAAEKYYKQVLDANPNDPKSYYIMAEFYAKYPDNGGQEKAVEMYQKRITLAPQDPEGYHYLANFYMTRRAYDKAIEINQQRLQIIQQGTNLDEAAKNKALSEIYYTLGYILWGKCYNTPEDVMLAPERIETAQKGIDMLDKAIEFDSTYAEPWVYKGLLLREKGKAEPLKAPQYIKQAEGMTAKFQELRKRKLAAEQFMQEQEKAK